MGILGTSEPEQDDNIVFPERILSEKIEYMAKQLQGKIEQINEQNDVDLPQINNTPKFAEIEAIDAKIAEKYEYLSENDPENRENRRRLITARQRSQRLMEVYDTFRTMTDYDRVIDAIQVDQ